MVYLIIFLYFFLSDGYRIGDPVSMLRRSQYKQSRTAWSEMFAQDTPRFGISRTIKLNPLQNVLDFTSTEEFKLAFSIADDRFLTPWLTVMDGTGNYLNVIEFTFIYSGNYLKQVKWNLEYHPENVPNRPDHIYLRYTWEEQVETDSHAGLTFLVIFCTLLGWGSALLVLLKKDRAKPKKVIYNEN